MARAFVLLFVALAVVATANDYTTPEWKKEIAGGFVPYKKLALTDFRVDDGDHPKTGMYTHGFMHYEYQYRWTQHGGEVAATISKLTVRSGLDLNKTTRRSWFRHHERLLPHEQLHLDINELHSRGFASSGALPTGRGRNAGDAAQDLRTQLIALANEVSKQAQAEQDLYDRETAGGAKAAPQAEWNRKIGQRLRAAGIAY